MFGELCIILVTPDVYKYSIYIYIKAYNLYRRTIGQLKIQITMAHLYTYSCIDMILI